MTIRTNEEARGLRMLNGIREAGVSLDDQIDEINGMFDKATGTLARMPGKLLNSTSTTSTVWSIHQLRFRDTNSLVEKINTNLAAQPDLPPLPGMIFDLPVPPPASEWPPTNPAVPQMFGPDWPNNNTDAQDSAELSTGDDIGETPLGPTGYRSRRNGKVTITFTPSVLQFNIYNRGSIQLTEARKTTTGDPPFTGPCVARLAWEPNVPWLHILQGANGTLNGAIISFGFWEDENEFTQDWYVYVDFALTPVGTTVIAVSLTAVDVFGHLLYDIDGEPITGTLYVGVVNIGTEPQITLSGDLTWWVVPGASSSFSKVLSILNSGQTGSTLRWALSLSLPAALSGKLNALPVTGDAAKGETDTSDLTLDPSSVAAGDHVGSADVVETEYPGVTPGSQGISVHAWALTSFPATFYWWAKYDPPPSSSTWYSNGARWAGGAGKVVSWAFGAIQMIWLSTGGVWHYTMPFLGGLADRTMTIVWDGTYLKMSGVVSEEDPSPAYGMCHFYASTDPSDKPPGWP